MTPEARLTDVTLRDGLQMESARPSVEMKIQLVRKLAACGYSRLEVTSFVNPKWVPQFGDSEELCRELEKEKPVAEWMAFVPNEKGLERLLGFSIPWVSAFVAVSDTFNRKNVNQGIEETLESLKAVVRRARSEKRRVRIYVSTVFGCPYEKALSAAQVDRVLKQVASLSPDEVALSDTIGVALPEMVRSVVGEFRKHFPVERTALHLHATYGLATASALAGYDEGIRLFDGSTGGIGGCPYAKGATGNVATEDLAYAFHRRGAFSGFRSGAVAEALDVLKGRMGLRLQGNIAGILERGGEIYGVQ